MDIIKAKNHFLLNFARLSHLPLISNAEMASLFGPEVVSALAELELYNQRQKVCSRCTGRCCLLVDCELYTPELNSCPIQSYRPLLCRMHFCTKFARSFPLQVRELGDIFLESLLVAEHEDKKKAALFDTPPLSRFIPELVTAFRTLLVEFKKGLFDEPSMLKLIYKECEQRSNSL